MHEILRGRLDDPRAAPKNGERVADVARFRNVVIEQILSGSLEAPADYLQEYDEWVAVLHGAARLEAAGEIIALGPGDWVLIPTATPHRLLWTQPGTDWLAVHVHREGDRRR